MKAPDMSQAREGPRVEPYDPKYHFTLYIAGENDLSQRAEANLRRIIESSLPQQYSLKVVDVFINPRTAMQERVTITPMAVKTQPAPTRKVIGDFTNREKVLSGLGIHIEKCRDEPQE